MPKKFHIGDRVRTKEFGEGTIVAIRRSEAMVALDEARGLPIQQPFTVLEHVDPGANLSEGRTATGDQSNAGDMREDALQVEPLLAVDALRFGLVPSSCLKRVTIGFDELERWIVGRLPRAHADKPTFSEIAGAFGTGKSHTMAVVRLVAAAHGYITAHVEVDGRNVSLSDPKRLLESLWSTIEADGKGSPTPLLDLYVRAIKRKELQPQIAPRGIDRIRASYRMVQLLLAKGLLDKHGGSLDAVISCRRDVTASSVNNDIAREPSISRFDVEVKPMIGLKLDDRPIDFIESLLGHAIVSKKAGYRGLVITIDEFEVEHLDPAKWVRVEKVLDAIAKYHAGELDHPSAPLGVFVASVGEEGHVGDAVIDDIVERANGARRELAPLTDNDLRTLAATIHEIYCGAYEVSSGPRPDVSGEIQKECAHLYGNESGLVRAITKKVIAVCDGHYGPPAHASLG